MITYIRDFSCIGEFAFKGNYCATRNLSQGNDKWICIKPSLLNFL